MKENIAKQRALDFGKELANEKNIISDEFAISMGGIDKIQIPLLETQAEDSPRGFFADQFEVRPRRPVIRMNDV